jgi:hypothetical protein
VEVVVVILRLQLQVAVVEAHPLVDPILPHVLGHQVQVVKDMVEAVLVDIHMVPLVEVVPVVLVLMVLLELV